MIFADYLVSIVTRMGDRRSNYRVLARKLLQNAVREIGKEVVPGSSCLCPLRVISGVLNHWCLLS
jgi:hypothetical protein